MAKAFLLSVEGDEGSPNWDNRSVSVGVISVDQGGVQLVNTWDIFKWGKCYATVEPQGFTATGELLLLARPSVFASERVQPNCVSDWGLYETDLRGTPVRLPDDTKVPRFGRALTEQVQACKTDPDLIGQCFTIHGRLSAWNGGPSLRIWKVGTKRILGDHDDWPLPQNLAEHMSWDVEAWGDFEVCPFARERPGEMQMVCVESAKNVLFKNR